jgi:hydrogenase maturation protease
MTDDNRPLVLVAGLGNIFLGDDAFGSEVVARLAKMDLPPSVRLLDVGTRGVHLAYELLEHRYTAAILIDVVSKGGPPGTVYVLEPDDESVPGVGSFPDAHSIVPHRVLELTRQLGGDPGRVLIVGCEPSHFEPASDMSPGVRCAVGEATDVVTELIASLVSEPAAVAEV